MNAMMLIQQGQAIHGVRWVRRVNPLSVFAGAIFLLPDRDIRFDRIDEPLSCLKGFLAVR